MKKILATILILLSSNIVSSADMQGSDKNGHWFQYCRTLASKLLNSSCVTDGLQIRKGIKYTPVMNSIEFDRD